MDSISFFVGRVHSPASRNLIELVSHSHIQATAPALESHHVSRSSVLHRCEWDSGRARTMRNRNILELYLTGCVQITQGIGYGLDQWAACIDGTRARLCKVCVWSYAVTICTCVFATVTCVSPALTRRSYSRRPRPSATSSKGRYFNNAEKIAFEVVVVTVVIVTTFIINWIKKIMKSPSHWYVINTSLIFGCHNN